MEPSGSCRGHANSAALQSTACGPIIGGPCCSWECVRSVSNVAVVEDNFGNVACTEALALSRSGVGSILAAKTPPMGGPCTASKHGVQDVHIAEASGSNLHAHTFCAIEALAFGWTRDLLAAVAAACIPVIVGAGTASLPLHELVDWQQMTIRWALPPSDHLLQHLRHISADAIAAAQSHLRRVRSASAN